MMWLKACPRCRGDLYMEHNIGESYVSCLQCGHTLNKGQEEVLKQTQPGQRKFRPRRAA
jgi:hypothetical protein